MMKFLFYTASGNSAVMSVMLLGNKAAVQVGWTNVPPSREDEQEAEQQAVYVLGLMVAPLGVHVNSIESEYHATADSVGKARRQFLGGGQG